MLPEGWKLSSIGEHIDLLSGFAFKSEDYISADDGIKLLRGDNVSQSRLRWRDVKRYPQSKVTELSRYQLKVGDFVIAMDRTWIPAGVKVCEVVAEDLPCLLVQRVARLRALSTIRQDLLRQYFAGHSFEQYVQSVQTETAVPHISPTDIRDFEIALPPIAEQRRIAEILSTWDQAIAVQEQLVTNARAQKKALMQTLLTGKKRLPGFKGEWKTRKFATIASLAKERVDTTSLPPGARGIELEHIESETGSLLGFAEANRQLSLKTPFNTDHVLYGKLRPYLRKYLKPTFSGVASTEIWVLIASRKLCSREFLYFLVQSPGFEAVVDMSAGSKMPRADWDVVKDAPFLIPELDELNAISNVLEASEILVRNMQARVRQLQQEKSALMQQLLTGKRRVKVEAIEQ